MLDLPIEIWSYIFAIRRFDFEMLVLKFENELQYNISWKWKNRFINERAYYKFNDGTITTFHEAPVPLIGDYGVDFFLFNVMRFKIIKSNGLRSYSGGTLEDVLTFNLWLPITYVVEVYPRYNFKLKSFSRLYLEL